MNGLKASLGYKRIYPQEEREEIVQYVISQVMKGRSLSNILTTDDFMPSHSTFHKWLESEEKNEEGDTWKTQYERACDARNDLLADEIFEIADKQDEDVYFDKNGNQRTNYNVIERNKLQVGVRQWYLGKVSKKYSPKIDTTSGGEKLNSPVILFKLPDNDRG
jgi:hypothetical protein